MIGVDTNILVEILRNKESKDRLKEIYKEDLCTSEIVVYEILYGIYAAKEFNKKRLEELELILDTFAHIFTIDRTASVHAAKIGGNLSKQGKTIEHRDALIAGSLLANGCKKLMTKNIKDFENIKEIQLIKI